MSKFYNGNGIWLEGDCPECAGVTISYLVELLLDCPKHRQYALAAYEEIKRIFHGANNESSRHSV